MITELFVAGRMDQLPPSSQQNQNGTRVSIGLFGAAIGHSVSSLELNYRAISETVKTSVKTVILNVNPRLNFR